MDNEKLLKQLEEAKKDSEWVEKVRKATTREELIQVYKEKGIDLQEEINAYEMNRKSEVLNDEELTNIAGGGLFGDCPQRYDWLLCQISRCCHYKEDLGKPTWDKYIQYCDLGYFRNVKSLI
jgi:predicted ribosomally synthesized peptide with nif11-like leader